MEVTFGAVGDFISVALIIRDIITTLNDSRGSTRNFLELTQSLQVLEKALEELDRVFKDPQAPKELNCLRLVALDTAGQITRRATEFRERMKKYTHSLSHSGSGNPVKDTVRKLQWKLDEGDVIKFREEIASYTASLKILLHAITIQLITYNQTSLRQSHSLTETRVMAMIKRQAQNFHVLLEQVTNRARLTLQAVSSLRDDLKLAAGCIITVSCAVYRELHGLRTLVTRLERPIIEEHFTLEDALGRRIPIHLRAITSWDALEYIIREQFKGRNGEHRVARHRYALQDHATHRELSRPTPWSRAFRPYQKVNMSILCKEVPNESHAMPTKSCPWCHHVSSGGEATEIHCKNCNMFYTRVEEIEEIDAVTKDQQLHKLSPKFVLPSYKLPSVNGFGDFLKRRQGLKDTRRSRKYRQPQKRALPEPLNRGRGSPETRKESELKSDESDEDDVNGLVRVRLISKKIKARQPFFSYLSSEPATFTFTPPSELSAPTWAELSSRVTLREKVYVELRTDPLVRAFLEAVRVWEHSPAHDTSNNGQGKKLGLTKEKDHKVYSIWDSSDDEGSINEESIDEESWFGFCCSPHVPRFHIIHERTFSRCKTTQYWGPIDEDQQEGLDIAHRFLTKLKNDRLFEAPLGETPSKILDLGTGTGIWAIDVADEYPSAKVLGTDICAIQPTLAPPNCEFIIDDAQLSWVDLSASLDFVHIRALYGSIDDWPKLYRNAYSALVPGGWIEHLEFDITPYSEVPEVRNDKNHIFKQWGRVLLEAMDRTGKTGHIGTDGNMRKYMEAAGFVDMVEKTYRVPCGEWSCDQKLKEIGAFNLFFLKKSLEGFALFLLKVIMGWEYIEIKKFVERMYVALRDAEIRPYYVVTNVYAKRPEGLS